VSISTLFGGLKQKPSGHTFTAIQIPGRCDAYLGIDTEGRPCLFARAGKISSEPPMRTAHVSLHLGTEYDLSISDGTSNRDLFHSLRCETSEKAEIDTFLVLVEAFLVRNGHQLLTAEALASFFRSLIRLFSVGPAKDLESERQGLWGELFVMDRVRGFEFWAPFWHSETTRRFDFSALGRRVEVKTTTGMERVHHFSHRQIYALEGEEILVASILLREEDVGLSLRDLIDRCRISLQNTPFYLKLEKAIRQAGMEDSSESGPVFDASEAERNLMWFKSTDAPHFRIPEPAGVSETRYKVDLSTAPCVDSEELEEWMDSWSLASPALADSRREW
jgi:hypothetical protein